jgi:hypothetical protein
MPARLRNLVSFLLHQLPAALALGVLGAIAWWGYVWDWQIPTLPELLHPSEAKEEAEKKTEKKEPENANKPLPPFKLDSEQAVHEAGIRMKRLEPRMVDDYVRANGDIEFDQSLYAHLSARASGTA